MASTATPPDVTDRQLVLFRLADGVYAIDLLDIREIIPRPRATRLPGAPPYVAGLINVRGTIVTVIDLALRLVGGTADPAPSDSPGRDLVGGRRPVGEADGSVILVEHRGKLVGVAVDEVLEVQRFGAAQIEAPGPEHGVGGVVIGLGHSGASIVILLDIHALIEQVLL